MHDFLRDWRRWTLAERTLVPLGVVVSLMVAVIGLSS